MVVATERSTFHSEFGFQYESQSWRQQTGTEEKHIKLNSVIPS
jgi:hypothetical protein